MKSGPANGLIRAGLVVLPVTAAATLAASAGTSLRDFLHWLDFLAPVPGLSGLALLAAVPVSALLLFFAVNWVVAGFARQSGNGTAERTE